jgi:hypothetical protein
MRLRSLSLFPLLMKPFLFYCGLLLGLAACQKEKAPATGVSIRVRNDSAYAFTSLAVNTSGGENSYGALGPGQSSDYAPFARAYSYAAVKATLNGAEVSFLPYDYVGETPLQPGRYTYVVDVVNQANGTPHYLLIRLERP